MAHVEFDEIDPLITRMGMDLDVLAATFGRAARDEIAQRLRDRIRTLRGADATDVVVEMISGGRTRVRINVRDELDDTVKQDIENQFESMIRSIGAVPEGEPMSGPPTPGMIEILERA